MSRLHVSLADERRVRTMVPRVTPDEADALELGQRTATGLAREAFRSAHDGATRHLRAAAIKRRHLAGAPD